MILLYPVAAFFIVLLCWYVYIAVMALQKVLDQLHPAVRVLAYTGLFVYGYPLDIFLNLVIATVCFFDLPKELLLTARMKRYIAGESGRRERVAAWICAQMLNPFSSGKHC